MYIFLFTCRVLPYSKMADIISLNYLVEGNEVTKFQKNETISLKFKRKVQDIKHKVSSHHIHLI